MITIDTQSRTIQKNGKDIFIRSKLLFEVLLYLTNSNGVPRTDREIIEHCWIDSVIVGTSNVRVRIYELRKLIDDPHHNTPTQNQIIIRVPGVGYKINPKNIKLLNQNGLKLKSADHVFIKHAKMNGEPVVILQRVGNQDEWIVVPKSDYN